MNKTKGLARNMHYHTYTQANEKHVTKPHI